MYLELVRVTEGLWFVISLPLYLVCTYLKPSLRKAKNCRSDSIAGTGLKSTFDVWNVVAVIERWTPLTDWPGNEHFWRYEMLLGPCFYEHISSKQCFIDNLLRLIDQVWFWYVLLLLCLYSFWSYGGMMEIGLHHVCIPSFLASEHVQLFEVLYVGRAFFSCSCLTVEICICQGMLEHWELSL